MQTTIDKNNIQVRIIVKIPTTRTSKVESEAVPEDCSGTTSTSILSEVSSETTSVLNVCPASSIETVSESSKLMINKTKEQTYSSTDDS